MKPSAILDLPEAVHDGLLAHLLPGGDCEEAAFVFANAQTIGADTVFTFVDWMPVSADGFAHRSPYYLELADETRAGVIKRAHDFATSIVEVHSHPAPFPAAFSESDRTGLVEFVPHVMWRLKRRPYGAIVVGPSDFDALVWIGDPKTPQLLDGIRVNGRVLRPTGLTIKEWQGNGHRTTRSKHPVLWRRRAASHP